MYTASGMLAGAMLRTKSVKTKPGKRDGLRLLVARFRGRGLPASRYDVWMPNLGPSEALLAELLAEEIDWRSFAKRYREELFAPSAVDDGNRTIRNRGQLHALRLLKHLAKQGDVTLMCHCDEDAEHCHRFELQKLIESPKV